MSPGARRGEMGSDCNRYKASFWGDKIRQWNSNLDVRDQIVVIPVQPHDCTKIH